MRGRRWFDIRFAPHGLTRKLLSDGDEVHEFEIMSIDEYSDKSLIVTGNVSYNIENEIITVRNMYFFMPKRFYREVKNV